MSATTVAGRPSLIRPAIVTNDLVDSASGWRIWHVGLGDDPLALRAPYGEAPLVTGDRPHPLIPFCAPVRKRGETVSGGYVGRWGSR